MEVITTIMDTRYTGILFTAINNMLSQGPVYNFTSVFAKSDSGKSKTQSRPQ